MVQLVDVTEEEDIYYNYRTNYYINCTRTRAFPYKEYEQWPSQEKKDYNVD